MELEYLRILAESTGDDSNDDVGITDRIEDMLQFSTLDSTQLLVKTGAILAKDIVGVGSEKDPDKKIRKLKRAIRNLRSMRKKASELPNDGVPDHVWRAITGSWWRTLLSYGVQVTYNRDFSSVSEMTKDGAMTQFNIAIRALELELERLEAKQEKAKKEES